MVYSPEDDFLYYALDRVIGRYGPLSSASPTFVDDFFGSQGGVPLNTNSLALVAASSQYATAVDSASLSITGDLAIDMQIKPTTLPTVGNNQTLLSKWNENGNARSYRFDIAAVSGYFGDGSDGALTISVNTIDAPIDSACTGTSGSSSLSATNVSFATGQVILIHQTQGTGAGTWMRNSIAGYTAGTITTSEPLNATYSSGAQVLVLKEYTSVTVNSGITYTAKAWNGTVGGILAYICQGTTTITGSITAKGKGFRGGASNEGANVSAQQGEGAPGVGINVDANNGNGGGGGFSGVGGNGFGAGGGNGTVGANGGISGGSAAGGTGGAVAGAADLTTMVFGGGGGGGSGQNGTDQLQGEAGGGIVFISTMDVVVSGSLNADGNTVSPIPGHAVGAGGGAGGSILLKAQTATLGSNLITASGGLGSTGGGNGGEGRIHLDYYTSYTGTTTPTLDAALDSTLVTNTTYQLRLSLSSNGTNSQILAFAAPTLTTGTWQQVGVSWDAATGVATFFINAAILGTATGAFTSIANTTALLGLGAYFNGAGTATAFYNGPVDEVRLFNMERSEAQMQAGLSNQISASTAGLVAYYQLNAASTDSTSNANNLTLVNAPSYSTDVPYPSPTTRLDIDQSAVETGNTYAVPVAISEAATDRLAFTPSKDPQKSIQFNISNKGSGDWTVTIHDQYNNVVATSTVTNANLNTGDYEFVYANVWSPLTNFTQEYHAHITATTGGSPTVVTNVSNDLATADFVTYFQFLMTQTEWHPMKMFLNFWVIGNGHYLGKYDATLYYPNLIDFGSGWVVRSLAYWREYLAIGVQWGQNIYDSDRGRIYFWDGIAPTYNFFIDVPEGGINAMLGAKGLLNIIAGWQGFQMVYRGGDTAEKIKQIPLITPTTYTEVYPGAMTMWKALLRYGVAGNGDTLDVQKGVYTWGSSNLRYPESLSYDYPISTGVLTGVNTKVGMVMVVDKKLLIGWQDNVSYGVDMVSDSNPPFTTATIEQIINDDDAVWHEKESNVLAATYFPLLTDEGVALKYKVNSAANWTYPDNTSGFDNVARANLGDGRYKEFQLGADLTANTTSPTINSLALERDMLDQEDRIG